MFIQDSYFTEDNYPIIIKPNVSALGTIKEIQPNFIGTQISFVHDDSFRDLLLFDPVVMYEKHNLLQNPVDKLLFDKNYLGTDIAQVMIFKGKRSGLIAIFGMDVDPRYKYIENFRDGIQ